VYREGDRGSKIERCKLFASPNRLLAPASGLDDSFRGGFSSIILREVDDFAAFEDPGGYAVFFEFSLGQVGSFGHFLGL